MSPWPSSLLLLLLGGCFHRPGDDTAASDCETWADATLGELKVCASAEVDNVWIVSGEGVVSGDVTVEYGLDDGGSGDAGLLTEATPAGAADPAFAVPVLGMKAYHHYSLRVVVTGAGGERTEGEVHGYDVPPPPQALPTFTVDTRDDALAQDGGGGLFLLSLLQGGNSWVIVIDRDGDYVWWKAADEGFSIPSTHLSPNGPFFVYTQNDRNQTSPLGGIVRIAVDGSARTITWSEGGHHDAVELPGEGTIAFIGAEILDTDIGVAFDKLAADTIWEVPIGADSASQAREVFRLAEAVEPWRMCSHFDAEAYNAEAYDWSHANSLMVAEDGDYYLMAKNFDALMKIDRETGALLWTLGDAMNEGTRDGTHDGDFTLVGADPDRFTHSHMSQVWGGGTDGHMSVFDNGYHRRLPSGDEVARSRATEYAWDEQARTYELVWEYDMPDQGFVPLLGDVRRLEGGNHLVSFTSSALVQEVTADGQVAWSASGDVGNGTGRITYLRDLYSLDEPTP